MKTPLPQATGERVLADWVTASLRAAIMQGYFEAGEKLDQDLIAEELQVQSHACTGGAEGFGIRGIAFGGATSPWCIHHVRFSPGHPGYL